MSIRNLFLAVFFLVVGAAAFARADTVAMVTDVGGGVVLVDSGDTVELLAELGAGDKVQVEDGGNLRIVFLSNGREFTVTGPAELQLETDGVSTTAGNAPEEKQLLAEASSPAIAAVGDLEQAAMVMRSAGDEAEVKLRGPLGGRVLSPPPTLYWEALDGVENYRVRITDYRGLSLLDERVSVTEYTLPSGLRLVSGATYTWSVEARMPDGARKTAFAEFALSDVRLRDEALKLKPADDSPFSERLVYALWLESNQLFQEADRYWDQLAEERPDSPRLQLLAGRISP